MGDVMKIIVNADDYGGTDSCTEAIYYAFKHGMITDTTIMANGGAYEKALSYIKSDNKFADVIGVHINLTAGKPLTEPIKKCSRLVQNGAFTKYLLSIKGKLLPLHKYEKNAIAQEICAQIQKCIDDGIVLSHADSHHHVHTNPQIILIFLNACRQFQINKVRIYKNIIDRGPIRNTYYRWFNKQLRKHGFVTTDLLGNQSECIYPFNNDKSTVEILVHPDFTKEGMLVNREVSTGGVISGKSLEAEYERVDILLNGEYISYAML